MFGAVLAYAATGHTVPDHPELAESLSNLIARPLSRDAAARPTAAELRPVLPPSSSAPSATVLDSAASLLSPGWLPGRAFAALARQSAQPPAAEIRVPQTTTRT
ncbi:hypothetical protein [Streptomyces sp. NBC_00467]|uniref:hypothetical protein n=1 Tax=Streptomyces sp. NBC_00467 TaxID=2975752 RepID=UPI002E19D7EA